DAVAVDYIPPGVDETDVRARIEEGRLARELSGPEPVVGVEERHVVPASRLQTGVTRRRRPAVVLVQDLDAAVVACEHTGGPVAGAVVGDEHLERDAFLAERAVERRGQVALGIVAGDDDADARGDRHSGRVVCPAPAIRNRRWSSGGRD